MQVRGRFALALGLAVATASPLRAVEADAVPDGETVILLVIDGVRFSEGFGDSSARYFPRLIRDLAPQGTYYAHFLNAGTTKTIPGHAAMLTGVYADLDNSGKERPHTPTLFEHVRKATGAPRDACWVVGHKPKMRVLTHSDDADYGADYGARFRHQQGLWPDDLAILTARRLLDRHPVRLMLLALAEPDILAHMGDWDGYVGALRRADAAVARLWEWVADHPRYRGRTTLIITSDHGRHLDGVSRGWKHHGDDCRGCRRIFCVVLGPAATPGQVITEPHGQTDLFALIAGRLGLSPSPAR